MHMSLTIVEQLLCGTGSSLSLSSPEDPPDGIEMVTF